MNDNIHTGCDSGVYSLRGTKRPAPRINGRSDYPLEFQEIILKDLYENCDDEGLAMLYSGALAMIRGKRRDRIVKR